MQEAKKPNALAVKRYDICERAITTCLEAIGKAAAEYGPRFKPNGAHEAILDEIKIRMSRRGRKPKSEATA